MLIAPQAESSTARTASAGVATLSSRAMGTGQRSASAGMLSSRSFGKGCSKRSTGPSFKQASTSLSAPEGVRPWLPSSRMRAVGQARRTAATRATSSDRRPPTFTLKRRKPSPAASRAACVVAASASAEIVMSVSSSESAPPKCCDRERPLERQTAESRAHSKAAAAGRTCARRVQARSTSAPGSEASAPLKEAASERSERASRSWERWAIAIEEDASP
jgi:hypothetical protein